MNLLRVLLDPCRTMPPPPSYHGNNTSHFTLAAFEKEREYMLTKIQMFQFYYRNKGKKLNLKKNKTEKHVSRLHFTEYFLFRI